MISQGQKVDFQTDISCGWKIGLLYNN